MNYCACLCRRKKEFRVAVDVADVRSLWSGYSRCKRGVLRLVSRVDGEYSRVNSTCSLHDDLLLLENTRPQPAPFGNITVYISICLPRRQPDIVSQSLHTFCRYRNNLSSLLLIYGYFSHLISSTNAYKRLNYRRETRATLCISVEMLSYCCTYE